MSIANEHFTGELTIDPEFASLCGELTAEERKKLEANLLEHGCLTPLVAWIHDGHTIVVEGHNRKAICGDIGVGYRVTIRKFANREAVVDFIIDTQLGRRNLSEERKAYLRGKRYAAEKKQVKNPTGTNGKVVRDQLDPKPKTAEKLGKQYGVSSATIKRDEKFATAVDTIAEVDPEAKQGILAGKVKLTAKQAGAVPKLDKPTLNAVGEAVAAGDQAAVRKALAEPGGKKAVQQVSEREPGDDTDAIKAEQAKRRNNGRETVSPKVRKEALAVLGKLVRATTKLGVHEKCRPSLERIHLEIKQA